VTDNTQAMAATVLGAVVGGIAGYLFLSDRGRRLRDQLEPGLDDFARELNNFRSTIRKASGVASESWKLMGEVIGESQAPPRRYPDTNQTTPF